MEQNNSHIKVLAISFQNIEKHIYFADKEFYFETMEAHLSEGMLAPKLVSLKHSFDTFECAFEDMCRFFPVYNYHLTFIHDEYKNELKRMITIHKENPKSFTTNSRSWLFFML